MAFCGNCGATQPDNLAFCSNCGAPMQQPMYNQPQQPMYNQPQQPMYNQPVVYGKPKIPGRGFGISSMVLGIIGLVYSLSALANGVEYADSSDLSKAFMSAVDFDAGLIIAIVLFASMSVMALAFGSAAKGRGYRTGVATAGVVLGVIGLIIYIISIILIATA